MRDTGMKMKYFVLSPGSSDKEHRAASYNAMIAYCSALRIAGKKKTADEIEVWASEQYLAAEAKAKELDEGHRGPG